MDYKVTPVDIVCEAQLSDELPYVKTAVIDDQTVFNAFELCRALETDLVDSRAFTRGNRKFVEWIIELKELDTSRLFYVNKSQDILMDISFVYTYLSFINKDYFFYFQSLIEDVMRTGIALSDSVIYMQASTRLPKDVLKQMASYDED